jgi:photosystem II stability/assembly factor-like uncharacterized protein
MRAAVAASLLLGITVPLSPVWITYQTGSDARLRGLSAASDRVVWASGTGGTVLRTTDAGKTWKRREIPGTEKLDFRDVDAFDEKTAYVLSIGNGEDSRIYRTSDGGSTWSLQLANKDPKVFLDAMAFWSPDRGIAFSDSVDGQLVIFTTSDGRSWTRVPAERLPPAVSEEGAYAASGTNVAVWGTQNVWIGTSRSRVLRSSDGGRSWAVATTPIPTGSAAGIFSIAFRDERNGVIVGGDYQKPSEAVDNAAFTSDGGATWTLGKGLTGYRSVVAYDSRGKRWYAAGPSGMDISEDDGRTWKTFGAQGFHTWAFAPGSQTGWGAFDRGRIASLRP